MNALLKFKQVRDKTFGKRRNCFKTTEQITSLFIFMLLCL